ncbi:hypothetical protein BDV23DRAFT_187240, partial [Aspergillus alliaceus]
RNADLDARIAHLDARNADLETRNADLDARATRLESQNKGLLAFQNHFFSVRERAFATFLRDYCREHGAKGHSQTRSARPKLGSEIRSRISQLNRSIIHGGLAEIDALMFQERRRAEELPDFEHVYGLRPSIIIEIASKGYKDILNLLNAAGGFHLQGVRLKNQERDIFDHVTQLVAEGKFKEADEASREFPFEEGSIAGEIITEVEVDDD